MNDFSLETIGLTKRYGDVDVLDGVSITFSGGEIHALLGANGAGKSTLCKIMAGLTPASKGSMRLAGKEFNPTDKVDAENHGVEIVQQELNLVGTLSVAENLLLSRLPNRGGVLRVKPMHRQARAILDRFGLSDVGTHTAVRRLGIGKRQMLEIAKALSRDCRLLILDEPTAALSDTESQFLFKTLASLREQGVAIVYISHRLEEVKQISDRLTVLRDGQRISTVETRTVSTDDMVDLMSGATNTNKSTEHRCYTRDQIALTVDSICNGPVQDVSLKVKRGQRLGITGLVGSGRTELLRAIFGADHAASGTIQVGDGSTGRFKHPSEAVKAGLAMVTEDRKENGLLLSESIRVNATIAALKKRFTHSGLIRKRMENREVETQRKTLDLQCVSIEQPVGQLSGGNQQKVVVSKWLLRDAEVFLFDEPTR
ncbi:MAG: sugar ABC transporter ATP-binding protein, partial [Planctomycetota bacterium]